MGNGNNLLVDINECKSNPCENDSTCTDVEDGYTCACESGFTGPECQTGMLIFSLSSEIFHLSFYSPYKMTFW